MTTMVNVRLLGAYSVTSGNEPLQFRTDKIKALFAYLLLHAAAPVRRETLATLFWPSSSDSVARKNLRDALFHLRKTLDRHDATVSQRCLHATRKTVTLQTADFITADTLTLTIAHPTPDLAPLLGGELLAGFSIEDAEPFMDWLLLERSHWHNESLRLLAQWTDHYLQQKEAHPAQQLAQRQLALEPWHEAAHRQAMTAHGLAHDWAGVAHQYALCCEVLQTELGIEPSAATQTLYQELQKQQQALLTPQHNLPTSLSPFVGRQRELVRINAAIEQRDYRLFTLTGIGGSGKTRLALEVGNQQLGHFPDGVWFVPLASADHVEDVLPAIASATGFQPTADAPLAQQLHAHLADKSTLLILDNLEQLPEEIADIVFGLLRQTKRLVILATTRARLNLRAENLFPIGGLDFPEAETADNLEQYEAIKLFAGQAARVRFDALGRETYGIVGEICRLLVGSPLAIELAAAQCHLYSVNEIAATLRASVATLATTMRDVPPRQRSLRAVFDYSWRLLNAAQQQGLAQLALFRQPFSAEAARAVAQISPKNLAALTKSSWLSVGENGRYLLHELLREFGQEKLWQQPAWLETTQHQYVSYHLSQLKEQSEAIENDTSGQTLIQLRQSRADLAYAWQMGVEQAAFTELTESVAALGRFYRNSGLLLEGRQLFNTLVAQVRQLVSNNGLLRQISHLLANLLLAQAIVEAELTINSDRVASLDEAISLAEQLGERQLALRAQLTQIDVLCRLSQFDEAYSKAKRLEPIVQAEEPPDQQANFFLLLGNISAEKQEIVRSEHYLRQARALIDKATTPLLVAEVEHNLANTLIMLGRLDEARHLHEETLFLWEKSGWESAVYDAHSALATTLYHQRLYDLALNHAQQSLTYYERVNHLSGISDAYLLLGDIGLALGKLAEAEQQYQQVIAARQKIARGAVLYEGWAGLAEVALQQGHLQKAQTWVQAILPLIFNEQISGENPFRVYLVCYRVLAKVGDSRADEVLRLAVSKLQVQAELLTEPAARKRFLYGLASHRGVMAAAGKTAV